MQAIAEDYDAILSNCTRFARTLYARGIQVGSHVRVQSQFWVCKWMDIEPRHWCPHADMLNHYRPRETKWTFDEATQAFTITTLQAIPAGAEVLDSYGQKCNHRFLLNYGFAVEDNRELDGFCPNEVPWN